MPRRLGWLTERHPAFIAHQEEWRENARRHRGGRRILRELQRFDWEKQGGEHYRARQSGATYLNFPDRYTTWVAGQLSRVAPVPNFGTLGSVVREADAALPSPAEIFFYDVDGRGASGSSWMSWWPNVTKHAINLGHRWCFVEAPREAPGNRAREMRGQRPVLRSYSPLAVPNWEFDGEGLAFVVIEQVRRRLAVMEDDPDARLTGNRGDREWLVYVRRGYTALDTPDLPLSMGGWYRFDADHELLDFGDLDATDGQIPGTILFYDRLLADEGEDVGDRMGLSRSGTTELGRAAVSYMNLASAADFDAWDAAMSVQALLGVDPEGYALFVQKMREGSRYAPVPPNADTDKAPSIVDMSMGAVVADVFDRRLKAKRDEAIELMLNEVRRGPDTSGDSLAASFADQRSPRLALFAAELQNTQNAIIHWVEQLWGNERPSGEVQWPKEFRIIDPMSAAREFYEVSQLSGIRSATLDARIMEQAAEARGFLLNDEERTTIQNELKESARRQMELRNAPVPVPGTPGVPGSNGRPGSSGLPGRPGGLALSTSGSGEPNGAGRRRQITIVEKT